MATYAETVGFIGTGNMGGALAQAAAWSGCAKRILLANRTRAVAEALAKRIGDSAEACDNAAVARDAQCIFLGVKPNAMAAMLRELQPILADRPQKPLLVTMAAGLTRSAVADMAGGSCPVIRIMPNTPVSIGAGMVPYCADDSVPQEAVEAFRALMAPAGRVDELPEALIDAACALSGCGPAYVYLFIEALADGAVACGLPRAKALEYAAATVQGAAQMVLQSGRHPGELKDAVCSPGGATIQGLRQLERSGFRAAAMEAVVAAFDKTLAMKK